MRNIARIFALLLLGVFMSLPVQAAHKGEKTFGVKSGYVTRNESALAGIFFEYRFSEHFSLVPNIDYVFRHNQVDAFLFNIHTHFPFKMDYAGRFEFFPIAGVNCASWAHHYTVAERDHVDDVTSRTSRFGFTVGAGMDFHVTNALKLSFEGKFNGVKHLSTGIFTIGIGYCF